MAVAEQGKPLNALVVASDQARRVRRPHERVLPPLFSKSKEGRRIVWLHWGDGHGLAIAHFGRYQKMMMVTLTAAVARVAQTEGPEASTSAALRNVTEPLLLSTSILPLGVRGS